MERAAALFCTICYMLGVYTGTLLPASTHHTTDQPATTHTDTITLHRVDTITVHHTPKPQTIHTTRIDTITLHDTITTTLPITQHHYTDTARYSIWISGYNPRLDSLHLYTPATIHTITKTHPAPRFSLGVQAGYGITPRGLQPYIGLGASYRLN